ncbi:MAG: hypothetical protein ABII96_03490 [Candidatus Zixiibacteriota bacterium]
MRSQKSFRYLIMTAVVVFFLAGTQLSSAQMPGIPNMPKMYGEFKMPPVGSYVIYKSTYAQNKMVKSTKLSIVGKEKSDKDEDIYWYEIGDIDPATGDAVITKMLISGNPQDIGTVYRMIIKQGKQQALELPQAMIQMINASPTPKTDSINQPRIKNLGTEKLKVGDQTFDCAHMRYTATDKTTADVWSTAKIPLFGMVKTSTPDATFELSSFGTDAVSAITEEPKVLEIPEQK